MPTVIPVKFKYAARNLWFDPRQTGAVEADHVICHTERGQEIGVATSDAFEVSPEELKKTCGDAPLREVVRVADEDDLARAESLAQQEDDAFAVFRTLVHESDIDMKPVGVEYPFGGGKVVCYFSAEDRVDFRKLVRDLSRELHERVDMRQIGVREEAAIIGGYGHCGQELCCRRFGNQFEPVSIRMAKEQDLPLNSSKISGACGRLMCCLRYEFEAYRDFKQRAPKRNALIDTPLGKAKIVEYDTPKEVIALRLENGKVVRIPLADMETSDAARKKSKELGCPCRPDTVTRTALEKLNSPDVQMALAELDRQNGVIPPEPAFHESDIFVDGAGSQSSRRRKRGGSGSGQHGQSRSEGKDGSQARSSASSSTRRRHHRGTNAPAAEAAGGNRPAPKHAAPQQEADASGAQVTRHRRRHHKSAEGAAQAQGAQREERAGSQGAKGAANGRTEGQEGGSGSSSRGGGMHPTRHRRHPGDHGGSQGQQQGRASSKPQGSKPQGQQSRGDGAQKQGRPEGPNGSAAPRKRHRRHHSSHGGSGGSGSEGQGRQKPSGPKPEV